MGAGAAIAAAVAIARARRGQGYGKLTVKAVILFVVLSFVFFGLCFLFAHLISWLIGD